MARSGRPAPGDLRGHGVLRHPQGRARQPAPLGEPLIDTPDREVLRADVAALAAIVRDSAGAGEAAAARWAAGRLREAGAQDVAEVGYRGRRSYGPSFAAAAGAGVVAAQLRGRWRPALAAAALWWLEHDAGGARLRRPDPLARRAGRNVTARIPAAARADGTVVLTAHLDAARTGVVWHPRLLAAGAERRRRTQTHEPALAPLAAGLALAGLAPGPLRHLGGLLCAVGVAGNLDVARPRTVPGANDNATGVAAVLHLARALAAEPLPSLDVEIVLPGGEEAGMDGFGAWLRARWPDPDRTVVVSLDTLGCGTPIVLRAEGALRTHHYRDEDLALADRGAELAGLPAPERWRIPGWTDPLLSLRAGIPSISLLSMGPEAHFTHYHHPTDLPEHVDWDCVERCARIAAGTVEAVAERLGRG